eukprot:TRINITY_DN1072_c0_g1_i3.p1 TRINITY_DN1072_c0_g1~~TRINITY_DN1072_c0_g1_i3.p1  ORF type:complete len:145 (+),score=24.70 TRINITY_DN1072_c0_g1_i3:140-574(+)
MNDRHLATSQACNEPTLRRSSAATCNCKSSNRLATSGEHDVRCWCWLLAVLLIDDLRLQGAWSRLAAELVDESEDRQDSSQSEEGQVNEVVPLDAIPVKQGAEDPERSCADKDDDAAKDAGDAVLAVARHGVCEAMQASNDKRQ